MGDFSPRRIHSISILNEMYSHTSSHSPTLKLAKDLAAILLPFKCLLTFIKAGAGAAQLGLPPT